MPDTESVVVTPVPTIAQKIRATIDDIPSSTSLASGTIAEALRIKHNTEGITVASAYPEPASNSEGS